MSGKKNKKGGRKKELRLRKRWTKKKARKLKRLGRRAGTQFINFDLDKLHERRMILEEEQKQHRYEVVEDIDIDGYTDKRQVIAKITKQITAKHEE